MKIRVIIYSLLALVAVGAAYMRLTHTPKEKVVDLEYYVPKAVPGKPQMAQMMDPVGGGSGSSSPKSPTVVDIYKNDKGQPSSKPPSGSRPK